LYIYILYNVREAGFSEGRRTPITYTFGDAIRYAITYTLCVITYCCADIRCDFVTDLIMRNVEDAIPYRACANGVEIPRCASE